MKQHYKISLKVLFTFFIIWIIFKQLDLSQLISAIFSANLIYLIIFILLYPLSVLISAKRWQMALHVYKIDIPFKELYRSYWLSSFYNNFLFHEVGGDMYKSIELSKRYNTSVKKLFYTSFIERVYGLGIVLVCVAVFGTQSIPSGFKDQATTKSPLIIAVSVILFCVIYLYFYIKKPSLKTFNLSISLFKPPVAIKMIPISVLLLIQTLLAYWFIFFSLGEDLSILQIATYVPLILLSGVLPLTPNSLGVREGAAVIFLGQTGITTETILAGMLLIRGLLLLTSSVGAFMFLHTNIFKEKS